MRFNDLRKIEDLQYKTQNNNVQYLQEQLTRSILPQHIVAKIKKDFRDIFKFIEEHKKSPAPKGRPHRYMLLSRDLQLYDY